MLRARSIRWWIATMLVALVACSGAGDPAGTCPEGFNEDSSSADETSGASTREEAIRAELDRLEVGASDDAIAEATIAASPGPSAGSESVVVDTDELGDVRMTLEPLDPGWTVSRSRWCAPI